VCVKRECSRVCLFVEPSSLRERAKKTSTVRAHAREGARVWLNVLSHSYLAGSVRSGASKQLGAISHFKKPYLLQLRMRQERQHGPIDALPCHFRCNVLEAELSQPLPQHESECEIVKEAWQLIFSTSCMPPQA